MVATRGFARVLCIACIDQERPLTALVGPWKGCFGGDRER